MMDWLRVIAYALLIAAGVSFCYIFTWIYLFHGYGKEDNPVILGIEMAMGIPIALLGIYLLIRDYRR